MRKGCSYAKLSSFGRKKQKSEQLLKSSFARFRIEPVHDDKKNTEKIVMVYLEDLKKNVD